MRNKIKYEVFHLSYSDYIGGASIAAKNIDLCLKNKISSKFYGLEIKNHKKKFTQKIKLNIRLLIGLFPKLFFFNNFKQTLSFAILNSNIVKKINNHKNTDLIVNLHWINRETISIKDIGKINKNLVWTCHDMWPILGAKHISKKSNFNSNSNNFRYLFDFDYWTYLRKKKYLGQKKITFIVPSKWLKKKVEKSKVYKNKKVHLVGNPIDCSFWKKIGNYKFNGKILNIVFGGSNISNDDNKGLELAIKIFNFMHENLKIKFIVSFFGSQIIDDSKIKFPFKNYKIVNKYNLRKIYSKSDLMIVTSKIESFCQVAAEAQSCSVPVISYKSSGLIDVVKNNYSGYHISKYNHREFAYKIYKLLNNKKKLNQLAKNARIHIRKNYDFPVVSKKYNKIY